MPQKPIHIALTFDDNFWAPAFATMRSVCLATHRKSELNFHLSHLALTDEHRADLEKIAIEFGAHLHWYDMSAFGPFQDLAAKSKSSTRWPEIIYARLLLGLLVPEDVTRILYLDCDTYVRGPVEELMEMDMEGFPIAGVNDILFPFVALGRDLRQNTELFDAADPYFNSGVLLIDMQKWREIDVPAIFSKAIADGTMDRIYYDQDFLNLTFRNNWLPLDWRFNVMDPRKPHQSLNPHILHYTDKRKPWNLISGVAFTRVYRHVMTNEIFYRFMRERTLRRVRKWLRLK